jgi:hypothetical protein
MAWAHLSFRRWSVDDFPLGLADVLPASIKLTICLTLSCLLIRTIMTWGWRHTVAHPLCRSSAATGADGTTASGLGSALGCRAAHGSFDHVLINFLQYQPSFPWSTVSLAQVWAVGIASACWPL